MKKIISCFSSMLFVIIIGFCSAQNSDRPSVDLGRQVIQQNIDAYTKGSIRIDSFSKTDGQSSNFAGVNYYKMYFKLTLMFTKSGYYTFTNLANEGAGSNGYLSNEDIWSSMVVRNGQPDSWQIGKYVVPVTTGQTINLSGVISFQKTENGWGGSFDFSEARFLQKPIYLQEAQNRFYGEPTVPSSNTGTVSSVNSTSNNSATNAIIDNLQGSTLGNAYGISYVQVPNQSGTAASFTFENESKIEYQVPNEGTIEIWVNISEGFSYDNFQLRRNMDEATIFTTTGPDAWWPGSTWLEVDKNGDIHFEISTTNGNGPREILIAKNTSFRFNEWHQIGISYGNQGQYIYLDGQIITYNKNNTQPLSLGGVLQCDKATIGYFKSSFWGFKQYDLGFAGIVKKVKISNQQEDW